jgi:uncharacterized Tic20 family protein
MQENSFLGKDSTPEIVPTSDEKTLALLAHILTFVAPILAPLIIYLVKKDDSQFVAYHAKESLNFQITLFVIVIILVITIIGILLLWARRYPFARARRSLQRSGQAKESCTGTRLA